MKKQLSDHLTSFAGHLDEQYGKLGAPAREAFEVSFKTFKSNALMQGSRKQKVVRKSLHHNE